MKKFFEEFKAFALRGNVIDLSVGVLIGGAFSTLVGAFTTCFVQPIMDVVNTAGPELGFVLKIGPCTFLIGEFISAFIQFLITAMVIFLMIKGLNKIAGLGHKKEEPAAPAAPTTKECPYCKSTIAIDATRCPHCTSELQ